MCGVQDTGEYKNRRINMSNFSRKIKKNIETNKSAVNRIENFEVKSRDTIIDTFRQYAFKLDFTNMVIIVELTAYNKRFFQTEEDIIDSYTLVFGDYAKFCNICEKKFRFEEFLKDSVANNPYLCDSLSYIDFTIPDNEIICTTNKQEYINMGEFYCDNYKINISGSYLFCQDLLSDKKFIYYGD